MPMIGTIRCRRCSAPVSVHPFDLLPSRHQTARCRHCGHDTALPYLRNVLGCVAGLVAGVTVARRVLAGAEARYGAPLGPGAFAASLTLGLVAWAAATVLVAALLYRLR